PRRSCLTTEAPRWGANLSKIALPKAAMNKSG
ncbi:MAG: hypothetical protein ACI9R3_003650, partial [Verrucomicrobiales bacterium]